MSLWSLFDVRSTLPGVFLAFLGGNVMSEDCYERGFQDRSTLLTEQVADHYKPPSMEIGDPEKYYWPKVMARFEKYGTADSTAVAWIELLKHRSPFHFTLVGMARLMYRYRNAEVIAAYTPLILKKVFERTDNHNAWTSEGTENHLSMARTSGYLYAQRALEAGLDGSDTQAKLSLMDLWIRGTARKIFMHGTAEWNSSTYEVYNLIGWLNLCDYAADDDIRAIARAVVDYYALEMAMFYSWGAIGGPEMRGSGVSGPDHSAARYLCWLWYGEDGSAGAPDFSGSQYIQVMHAVTSRYRPPKAMIALARKKFDDQWHYTMARPSYLYRAPAYCMLSFLVDPDFTLGSYAGEYGGWTGASAQIVPWKLCLKRDEATDPYQISGNGALYEGHSGRGLDPFTQVAQHRNVLVQMTRVPANAEQLVDRIGGVVGDWQQRWAADFRKRFPGAEVNPRHVNMRNRKALILNQSYISFPADAIILGFQNGIYRVELGNVVIMVQSIGDLMTELAEYEGRRIMINAARTDHLSGFVLEVLAADGMSHRHGAADFYTDGYSRIEYRGTSAELIQVQYGISGSFTEPIFDWGYGPNKDSIAMASPPFVQPVWPQGVGFGRVPEVWIDGDVSTMRNSWPVYKGPGIRYGSKGLEVQVDGEGYRIDFSGHVPRFHINHQEVSE